MKLIKCRKICYYFFITFVIFLFSFNCLADYKDTVKRTFDVKQGGLLRLESDLGSIHVTSGTSNRVEVKITREVDVRDEDDADRILDRLDIDFNQKDDDIYVNVVYDKSPFFWKNDRLKIHFDITVPKKYNIDLKTAGGSIYVDDLEGEVRSSSSGGSITFGNIEGPVRGSTSGGSITLNSSSSNADLSTSGGSIKIGNVDGKVNASTSGGSITVDEVKGTINATTSGGSIEAYIKSQPENNCKLKTSGGGINIYLDKDVNVNIDAKTSGGKVKTDFPVMIHGEIMKNKLKAEINGGGPELYMRTSGGNICIHEI